MLRGEVFCLRLVGYLAIVLRACEGFKIVAYWGQNSNSQEKTLAQYCSSKNYDVISIAFVTRFPDVGYPEMNLAHCSQVITGTKLLSCSVITSAIQTCQRNGKRVTISMGGSAGTYGISNSSKVAQDIWDVFLGGKNPSAPRPFGTTVLDGVDLDVEQGSGASYAEFVGKLRSLMKTDRTRLYMISASPGCAFPDPVLHKTFLDQGSSIDEIYVKSFNDKSCDQKQSESYRVNMAKWFSLADDIQRKSGNPVNVYLGLLASSVAASSGFLDALSLRNPIQALKRQPRFGGVMLWSAGWDESYLKSSGSFYSDLVRKEFLVTASTAYVEVTLPVERMNVSAVKAALLQATNGSSPGLVTSIALVRLTNDGGSSKAVWEVAYLFSSGQEGSQMCTILQTMLDGKNASGLHFINITISSTDCCFIAAFGEEEFKGIYTVGVALVGDTVFRSCMYEEKVGIYILPTAPTYFTRRLMSAKCAFDNNRELAIWENIDFSSCPAKTFITQKLEVLSKALFTTANVEIASEGLLRTMSGGSLTNSYEVEYFVEATEQLLRTGSKFKNVVENIFQALSLLLNADVELIAQAEVRSQSSAALSRQIATVAENLQMRSEQERAIEKENVALRAHQPRSSMGVSIWSPKSETGLLALSMKDGPLSDAEIATFNVSMYLPPSVFDNQTRNYLYALTMTNAKLFMSEKVLNALQGVTPKSQVTMRLNSQWLGATVGSIDLTNLRDSIEVYFKVRDIGGGVNQCVFWNETLNTSIPNVRGVWSTNGCRRVPYHNKAFVKCECNHLTNFALILDTSQSGANPVALRIVSWIGCGISMAGLALTILTFLFFRNLRSTLPAKILISFCVSLILTLVFFLAGVERTESRDGCTAFAAIIHYFVLATFCWMSVEASQLYRSFVSIFYKKGTSDLQFILAASGYAWGVPIVIVAISIGLRRESYGPENIDDPQFCLVRGNLFYFALLLPVVVVLLANMIVLIIVMVSISRAVSMHGKAVKKFDTVGALKNNARIAFSLSMLLGLTWLFAILAVGDVREVFQWLFCVFNSLQGFFVFVFFAMMSKDVQIEWKRFFRFMDSQGSRMSESTTPNPKLSLSTNYLAKTSL